MPMAAARLQLVPRLAADDEALVRALRAKDTRAAGLFFSRTRPTVSRTIHRLIRASSDHDELVQLSMIELMLTIARFKGECSLDQWAAAVTARVTFKYLRSKSREHRLFSGLTEDSVAHSVAAGGTHRVVERDLLERLTGVLRELDEAKATAFVLHDVHGYDLAEVAEIIGISISNAQTRLVRGRRELHERLSTDPELATALQDLGGTP